MLFISSLKKLIYCLIGSVICAVSFSAFSHSKSDKILEKYEKWKAVVNNPKNAKNVFAFFYNNPHWPLFDESVREAEKNVESKASKKMALKWFKRYSPKTKEGLEFYIKCLFDDNPEFAKEYVKKTWIFQNLSPEFMAKYKIEFSDYVSPVEDAKKTKRLMKGMKIKQLLALKDIVIDEISNYISDFLQKYITSKSGGYSEKDLKDIDKKYTIVQKLIDKKQYKKAADILLLSNQDEEKHANSFFNQRRHVAYELVRSGKPEQAYKVMEMYKLETKNKDENIARAEWLLGYIAYRFLNDFNKSDTHFKKAFDNSLNSIRISKNAFWLAEVYRKRNDIVLAINWYKQASKYFSTFYGYLAEKNLRELYPKSVGVNNSDKFNHDENVPSNAEFTFHNRELVQVLMKIKDKSMRKHFYRQLIYEIEDPNEEMLLMNVALANNEMDILISENSKRQHYFSNAGAYKILGTNEMGYVTKINSDPFFISFVHSIIRRESNFNPKARSYVGAIGLMQIMPATAKYEAKKHKIYIGGSLYDPKTNITIGSAFLNRLLKKYDGNVIYAAAAYNMGEGAVSKYRKSLKKINNLKPLDIIELIPYKETRLYVKHVIRSLFTYQKKFKSKECESCRIILDNEEGLI